MQDNLRSDLVGKKVLDRIQLGEYSGKVLSSVTGAVYLLGEDDEVLWLTSMTGMHARAIRLENLPTNLVPQSQFTLTNKIMNLSGAAAIDLSGAAAWIPTGMRAPQMLPVQILLSRIGWLLSEMTIESEPRGMGMFLPAIHEFWIGKNPVKPTPSSIDPVLQSAWHPLIKICWSCQQQDWQTLLLHCADFVGLGYGLTPSGDDFIGGLVFCLQMLQDIFPSTVQLPQAELDRFISSQQFKTNIISYSILKDMFEGCSSEAVHTFTQTLFYSESVDDLTKSATSVIQIGHSTGWDTFTGILAGCLCLQSVKDNISYEVSKERMLHGH